MSKLYSVSGRSVRKPSVTIKDADVVEVLLRLRKDRLQWKPVIRSAQLGDQVAITYNVTSQGKIVEAQESTPRFVVLGSDKFHKSIERRYLLGARQGEHISATALLPRNYSNTDLAGRRVVFNIFIVEICKPVLPSLNRHFALDLGLSSGGTKTIHKEVRGVMQAKIDAMTKHSVRRQVIDILLPNYLLIVDGEEIQHEVNRRQQAQTVSDSMEHPDTKSSKLTVDHFRALARLNAIMKDIVRTENIVLDVDRLNTSITALAFRSDDPEAAIKGYYNSFEEMSRIEAEILEDQIIEHVMSYLKIKDVPISYKKFTSAQTPFASLDDWSTQPIILLKADNKCSFCGPTKCCQYITQKIPAPRSKKDFDHLLWQVSHEKVEIFKDSSGWYLLFETTCTNLQLDGGCRIYESRPSVCRNYSVKNCEFDGAPNRGWELHFIDHSSLLEYCKNRFKHWEL